MKVEVGGVGEKNQNISIASSFLSLTGCIDILQNDCLCGERTQRNERGGRGRAVVY